MNRQRLSAILLIASFLVLVFGSIFTPPGLYQETDIDLRMQIIEEHASRFTTAQVASIIAAAGIATGYLFLSLHLQGTAQARWASLGATAMILGTFALGIYNLLTLSDPRTFLDNALRDSTGLSFIVDLYAWLTIAGYLLYGNVFLRGDFPNWLAYATLGIMAIVLLAVLLIDTFFVEVLFLLPLLVGIALLRRPRRSEVKTALI